MHTARAVRSQVRGKEFTMKRYEITARRANGTEFKDVVYAENERAARRDFNEIYRHGEEREITNIKALED